MGRPDAAKRRADATVAHAGELGQPFPLTIALQVPAFLGLHAGDVEATAAAAREWLACATTVGNPVYIGLATACAAWARAAAGDREGLAVLAGVRLGFVAEGVGLPDPLLVTALADAYLRCGEAEAGLALLADTMPGATANGQVAYQAEQLRLRGELTLLTGGDPLPDFNRALELARRQGAVAYEQRAAQSLDLLAKGKTIA